MIGASRAESAACVRTGRTGSLDPALPVQAAGRHGNKGKAARAGRGTPAVRLSAIRMDARTRRSHHQHKKLYRIYREESHGRCYAHVKIVSASTSESRSSGLFDLLTRYRLAIASAPYWTVIVSSDNANRTVQAEDTGFDACCKMLTDR